MKAVYAILAILFLPGIFCCNNKNNSLKMTIELEVFSGRSNPTWVLDKPDAERLQKMLQNLPLSASVMPEVGLGYRGFTITGEYQEKTSVQHIYNGKVWMIKDPEKIFEDIFHAEEMLLKIAREKGYGELLLGSGK
jgi:hypothetical protein